MLPRRTWREGDLGERSGEVWVGRKANPRRCRHWHVKELQQPPASLASQAQQGSARRILGAVDSSLQASVVLQMFRSRAICSRRRGHHDAGLVQRSTCVASSSADPNLSSALTSVAGEALALCLQNSDCVLIHRHTPADCLRPPLNETLPTTCKQLKYGYAECKKGQIDMRKRFLGNKPISTSAELEAGGSKSIAMLYAGKGSYEGVGPKATDGREARGGEGDEEYERFVRNDGIEDVRKK